MKKSISSTLFLTLCLYATTLAFPIQAQATTIETFTPQGTVKAVRQVSARFSGQMVPFGDPRTTDPFDISCPAKGTGRWADGRNWIYDFEKDLPGGIMCSYTLKKGLKDISGNPITGQGHFSFSTGGPAILQSSPHEGQQDISEDQVFILLLDTDADEASVLSNVSCSTEGVSERIGIRIIKGEQRDDILKNLGEWQQDQEKDMPKILIQCRQNLPAGAMAAITWGRGIRSQGGIQTTEDQVLRFKTRPAFTATFKCNRENAHSDCIPILPFRLEFSAPVQWEKAKKIVLKTHGKTYTPSKPKDNYVYSEEDEETEEAPTEAATNDDTLVDEVQFQGPFSQDETFVMDIPKVFTDNAGRSLSNSVKFPLTVKTGSYPPLAKFAARFGIIELNAEPALPLTLRNTEAELPSHMLKVADRKQGTTEKANKALIDKAIKAGQDVQPILPPALKDKSQQYVEGLKGRLRRIRMDKEEQIIDWIKAIASATRNKSIFEDTTGMKDFKVPKPAGAKPLEVVGIPLQKAGFYVVEMESLVLGQALLNKAAPLYVPTSALVTNLSAHFKWGRESSLVWVTTLDKAEPVPDAAVSIRNCNGKSIWTGKTDKNGIARIKGLPKETDIAICRSEMDYQEAGPALFGIHNGLFIFARKAGDMTFDHSSWSRGIEPWRYNLIAGDLQGPIIAHAILDRSLLRAGETIHMKHIIRRHDATGFSFIPKSDLPKTVVISHMGSNQRYKYPLKWDAHETAETTWKIPAEAKLGTYRIYMLPKTGKKTKATTNDKEDADDNYYNPDRLVAGTFRVEEFRVPLMKATLQPPKDPLIKAKTADVDMTVTYLSGGGARDLPVRLRTQVQPKQLDFPDYDNYKFSNGPVKEGKKTRASYERKTITPELKTQTFDFKLDQTGGLKATIPDLPDIDQPRDILAELEFRDPNGEVQTVSRKIPLWPSDIIVGIRTDSLTMTKQSFKVNAIALDLNGKPLPNTHISVEIFEKKTYSHRKRLIGGFYSYENITETTKAGPICEGNTDESGLLICDGVPPASGNVLIQAKATDQHGNDSYANADAWIRSNQQMWFDITDNDRIDLLPEKKRYDPGDTARFQVRMPFKEATALVTVEREGVMDTYIKKISGDSPVVEIPVKKNYAPNVFASVLALRGRVSAVQPTALVDLGKPAYKLGIAEIRVGWKAHKLDVRVSAERDTYKVREKARVRVSVRRSDGTLPPKGTEVAVAAVDKGLLELMPNKSWNILEAMMGRRTYEVSTSTAQMQVVGKRHYGIKALPQGGGGGQQITRDLFDTLLLWKGRLMLDEKGEATIDIPINDSLTAFRIVAVASGGAGLYGTGHVDIRSSQDLMILPGIPQTARTGDRFKASFTVRNTSQHAMAVDINARVTQGQERTLEPLSENIEPGQAKSIGWDIAVPAGIDAMNYQVNAQEKGGGASDTINVRQKVTEAIPVKVHQATLTQLGDSYSAQIERPQNAIPGRGGIQITYKPRLSDGMEAVTSYMKRYPYTCMEQKVSQAIALRDRKRWEKTTAELPAYMDSDGLVKYFPTCKQGSDTLTAYIFAIANEAGWPIPDSTREKMTNALKGFIEGRITRYSPLPTADLSIRKIAAIEALSRYGKAEPRMLDSVTVEPNLWPTSAVIDWMGILLRMKDIPLQEKQADEAEQIIRSRINFHGTTMGFSTEGTDNLWWLMLSADQNALKTILTFMNHDKWKEDMPRLVRGALGRQYHGIWLLTTANAWGVLAMEKFSQKFEAIPVSGIDSAAIGKKELSFDWKKSPKGTSLAFDWPRGQNTLRMAHKGNGKPWATIQSLAAIPLKETLSSGYRIKKTVTPIGQRVKGEWSSGDTARIRLDIEAQADMTWVVVNDPVPTGAAILGTGLGRDSELLTQGEQDKGWIWPTFEERSFQAYRAYYEFVPKGRFTLEYTVRLNSTGDFQMPPTRVEALYSPEMTGEMPNKAWKILP